MNNNNNNTNICLENSAFKGFCKIDGIFVEQTDKTTDKNLGTFCISILKMQR